MDFTLKMTNKQRQVLTNLLQLILTNPVYKGVYYCGDYDIPDPKDQLHSVLDLLEIGPPYIPEEKESKF